MIYRILRTYFIGIYGLCAQSPELDLAAYGTGPFISTEQSPWALFRNMAGLAPNDSWQTILAYHYPYNLTELQSLSWGLVIPCKPIIGVTFFQSGGSLFRNQQAAVNTSLHINRFYLGLRVKYWRFSFHGIEPVSSASAALGLQIRLSDYLITGVFLGNITQSRIGPEEMLPTLWMTGISYKPIEQLQLIVEMGHELGEHWQYKFGAEYSVKEKFQVRSGINSSNRQAYFGLGFRTPEIEIDYALGIHISLGATHQAGIIYSWP